MRSKLSSFAPNPCFTGERGWSWWCSVVDSPNGVGGQQRGRPRGDGVGASPNAGRVDEGGSHTTLLSSLMQFHYCVTTRSRRASWPTLTRSSSSSLSGLQPPHLAPPGGNPFQENQECLEDPVFIPKFNMNERYKQLLSMSNSDRHLVGKATVVSSGAQELNLNGLFCSNSSDTAGLAQLCVTLGTEPTQSS